MFKEIEKELETIERKTGRTPWIKGFGSIILFIRCVPVTIYINIYSANVYIGLIPFYLFILYCIKRIRKPEKVDNSYYRKILDNDWIILYFIVTVTNLLLNLVIVEYSAILNLARFIFSCITFYVVFYKKPLLF